VKSTRALWFVQWLLALVFLFAGVAKLALPVDELTKQMPMLSGGFLRFVAVCEVLGAIGLILPGLLHIRPGLTPLAAAGLVVIMIGAVSVTSPPSTRTAACCRKEAGNDAENPKVPCVRSPSAVRIARKTGAKRP